MKQCNETITIFNARLDESTGYDVYYRTIITGVSWYCALASNVDSSGLKAANKFTVRVPLDADFSGKTFVDPIAYAAPGADPSTMFTLKNGDIVVRGAVAGDDNTRPSDLQKRYSEIFTILGVTDNRRANHGKHWKVVGA